MRFNLARSGLILDLAGDAALARVRHENKKNGPGKGEIGRGTRPLASDLSLCDLNDDFLADRKGPGNVLYGFGFRTLGFFALVFPDNLDRGIVVGPGKHIPIMKEGILLLPNVNEGGLESGLEVLNFPLKKWLRPFGLRRDARRRSLEGFRSP